jgi:hypothetical protein
MIIYYQKADTILLIKGYTIFRSKLAFLGMIEHTQQGVSFVVLQACLLIHLLADTLLLAILADVQALLSKAGKHSAPQADVPGLSHSTSHVAIAAVEHVLSLSDVLRLQIFP